VYGYKIQRFNHSKIQGLPVGNGSVNNADGRSSAKTAPTATLADAVQPGLARQHRCRTQCSKNRPDSNAVGRSSAKTSPTATLSDAVQQKPPRQQRCRTQSCKNCPVSIATALNQDGGNQISTGATV
jgi:hypothetical protein